MLTIRDKDLSGVGNITATSSRSDVLWGTAFPISILPAVLLRMQQLWVISAALIAEARFFRAFDYFLLVQTFGGVPLDLGAGELKFNTTPSRKSSTQYCS